MNSKFRKIIFSLSLVLLLVSCATVPLTGRSQLHLVSDNSMTQMSFSQYDKFLTEHKLSTDKHQVSMVKRVGRRIQHAVEKYLTDQGMSRLLDGYNWEFNLVDSKEENAWCMPGGKVVVYSGILPITRDETGLAVVMGHEIAHAVANHGNERMSQGLLVQLGGMGLAVALKEEPAATQQLWMTAFGVGSQYGILLPFSRTQEKEADHLGLIFMAMAGYDPHAALDFWQRMAAKKKGKGQPPEFLSTHPSDSTRIAQIRRLIPKAMTYYQPPGSRTK
jgi:predicted Zn-dependent protease